MDKRNVNPLEKLYIDANGQVDQNDLLTVLEPYIRISRESRQIIFTPDGLTLPTPKKVLLLILARKALALLGGVESEVVIPKEIKEALRGIPAGTIDVTTKRLSDKGLIRKEGGGYFIPDFIFQKVGEVLGKEKHGA